MPDTGSDRPRRRLTLRLRLTALYGACFLVAGAILLGITYGLVAHDTGAQSQQIRAQYVSRAAVKVPVGSGKQIVTAITAQSGGTGGGASSAHRSATGPSGHTTSGNGPTLAQGGSGAELTRQDAPRSLRKLLTSVQRQLGGLVTQADVALAIQRNRSLGSLLTWSGAALGAMAIISILLGWLLAGRALRPLQTMTARARQITEENLHERLAVDVREDELGALANTFDGVLARLERAFDSQRRFVANASHELRTPVTLERTLVEVALADPGASAETLRSVCRRILASTQEQERMIDALLTLARSQAGADHEQRTDLAETVRAVVDAAAPRLRTITVRENLQPAQVNGDPALLERMVSNLIDNAIVHNLPSDDAVAQERPSDSEIELETGSDAHHVWLSVSNTGLEVPPERTDEIFEPFRRLGTDRMHADGVGLGLSIVKAVADVHGGTVAAEPRPGGGLTVRVTLPSAAAVAGEQDPAIRLKHDRDRQQAPPVDTEPPS